VFPTKVPNKENNKIIDNIIYGDLTSKKMKIGKSINNDLEINAFIIKLLFFEPIIVFIREEKIWNICAIIGKEVIIEINKGEALKYIAIVVKIKPCVAIKKALYVPPSRTDKLIVFEEFAIIIHSPYLFF